MICKGINCGAEIGLRNKGERERIIDWKESIVREEEGRRELEMKRKREREREREGDR